MNKITKPIKVRRPGRPALALLLVAALMGATTPSWADSTAPSPPPVITPMVRGQAAPYTGVLLSPPAVAQVVAQQDTAAAAIQLAVQHQAELDAAQQKYAVDSAATTCTADKNVLTAELVAQQKQNKILADQLKSTPSPVLWVGIGTVGGVLVTLATVFVVSKVTH